LNSSIRPAVTLLVRHDEDRRVERRLLRPCLLTGVEHALAHHARAGALERLPHASSDIVTLKNTFPAISPQLPRE
jgi:hypothetical protein